MKILVFTLALVLLTVPAMAQDTAFIFGSDNCKEVRQDLSDCGQKVVDLGKETESLKQSNKDNIALAIGIGVFIGSGGISALVPVIGDIVAIPFIALGL